MGGDGGVIANQRRFMRACAESREKEGNRSIRDEKFARTAYCSQSAEILQEPIVACQLGFLYNKESILTALINKSLNPAFSHIRTLKDLKTLILTKNPEYNAANRLDDSTNSSSMFICPISRLEFHGLHPFSFIWTTGYVLSDRAIKEIGIAGLQAEYGPFEEDDIFRLIPSEEELTSIKERVLERRARLKAEKDALKDTKKRRHEKITSSSSTSEAVQPMKAESGSKDASLPVVDVGMKKCTNISIAKSVSAIAAKSYEQQTTESDVYKKLFHKDNEAAKYDRDLFMSVAGIRYTLR